MNMFKDYCWNSISPTGEPTSAVLLNGHSVKLFSTYLYLYPHISAILSFDREVSVHNQWWLVQRTFECSALNEMSISVLKGSINFTEVGTETQ